MAEGIFYHKVDSTYDDVTGIRYHFPRIYLSRVQQTIGDWIIYYGPLPRMRSRYYSGLARVSRVTPDPRTSDHFYAYLEDYLDFDEPLDYLTNGGFETKLIGPGQSINPGRSVQAVRIIEESEFAAIVTAGLSREDEWPQRWDSNTLLHVEEAPPTSYDPESFQRPILLQTMSRPYRDAKFRQHVRTVYDRTCAFTGLRLINGGGGPEVEAAHIVPVERGGNDSVQNGIALSGTLHWMFDRGLLSMGDDYKILCSRHLNEDVSHLLTRDLVARIPAEPRHRPHPRYLNWHRENVFKQ